MRTEPIALALVACSLTACSPIQFEGKMSVEGPLTMTEGTYISDRAFDRLEVGSESAWAIALFGEPEQKTQLSDGAEVWRWDFRHVGIDPSLLNFGGGSDTKSDEEGENSMPDLRNVQFSSTYVLIREGRIADKWRG